MKNMNRPDFRNRADAVRKEVEQSGCVISGAEYEIIYQMIRRYYEQDWMTDEEVLHLMKIALLEHSNRIKAMENELGEFFSTLNEPFLHRCPENCFYRTLGGAK